MQIPLSTGDTLAPPGMAGGVSPLQIPLSAVGETPPPPGMLGGPQAASLPLPPPPEPAADPEPAAEPPLPLDEVPLERCARIAAGVALRPSEQGALLEKEALTPAVWERLQAHFAEVLGEESRRGKNEEGRAYDEAYVGAVEAIRGPITPVEYAQITVAVERSEVASALSALDLVEAALPHVRRVWLQRIVSDPALAKQARSAVRAARAAG